MFNYTFEELHARALSRVTSGMDTSQGSFLYDAITSCTQELYLAYLYCDEMEKRLYADTAYNEWLERRCAERGISRETAVHSQRLAVVDLSNGAIIDDVIGSTWGIEDATYTLTGVFDITTCIATCDQSGVIGNRYSGSMINVNAINSANGVVLSDIIVAGTEDETDDDLRQRYFDSFNNTAFGGNIADYKQKVGALEGVGQVKVYPVWQGAGTVLVRILGNDSTIPSSTLIDQVQTAVDPTVNSGKGYGIAPIGHVTTVLGATDVNIDISATLSYKVGYSYSVVHADVQEVLENYIKGLRDTWSDEENLIIRIAQIEAALLDIKGIIDVTNTTINGTASNLTLNDDEVPNLSGVTIS